MRSIMGTRVLNCIVYSIWLCGACASFADSPATEKSELPVPASDRAEATHTPSWDGLRKLQARMVQRNRRSRSMLYGRLHR